MGDFYEMFGDDAIVASRELEITLTSRNKGSSDKTPMAGVPHHAADTYIAQLIKKGFKVAICEQLEDPAQAKGIVRRDVVRVVSPGTALDSITLVDDQNNYLAAIVNYKERIGFAYVDISTGEFFVTELDLDISKLIDELSRIQPAELILAKNIKEMTEISNYLKEQGVVINPLKVNFTYNQADQLLIEHFQTRSLNGFGCETYEAGILAAGAIMEFLQETQKRSLTHINRLRSYSTQEYMILDAATRRNLELTSTTRDGRKHGSLLGILDRTVTAMGSRKLKQWINQPLLNLEKIQRRLDTITELKEHLYELEYLREYLKKIYDIERLLGRVVYGSANARDLVALKQSLVYFPKIKEIIEKLSSPLMQKLTSEFDLLTDITELIETAIASEPPVSLKDGGLISDGYNQELDRLRDAATNGKEWIAKLEYQEKERTRIKSLKVGFNKVFGYYLEVTKANLHLVPDDYIRKQTLTNNERFVTPELKEKETLILGAEEKSMALEYDLFIKVREQVALEMKRIQKSAAVVAQLDVLGSLAVVAIENNYCRPSVNLEAELLIVQGRHPVVEEVLDDPFVPNDTYLNCTTARFTIITGPNMSGKSTYMRQVALITLLAQIGSFVPAQEARIGLVDRIFTRVGASDDLTTGQSTFMVEMNEVANIVHNATHRSLIILDEVGRGTSTYDGLSIAWAVIEYIHNPDRIGARTLFATHYHELTVLEEQLTGVRNYNVAVEENDYDGVVFRHEIIPGAADQSYGIEVARLAGLPQLILDRAREILQGLEDNNSKSVMNNREIAVTVENNQEMKDKTNISSQLTEQLSLFTVSEDPIIQKIKDLDLVNMTPLDAINTLYQLKKELEGK